MADRPRVLLVENEWLIAVEIADCLTDAGFSVAKFPAAEPALALLEDQAREFSAIVADVRLAGAMSGIGLVCHAARCWPWLSLLIVSGETSARLALRPPDCDLLQKPCQPEEVLARLWALLQRRPRSPSVKDRQ